jgi:hypothetical protein
VIFLWEITYRTTSHSQRFVFGEIADRATPCFDVNGKAGAKVDKGAKDGEDEDGKDGFYLRSYFDDDGLETDVLAWEKSS